MMTTIADNTPLTIAPAIHGLPQCRVILHNDELHDMAFVTDSLQRDLHVTSVNAWRLMLIAHHYGKSLVLTAHRELAELYRDKLQSRGLTVSLEPAGD